MGAEQPVGVGPRAVDEGGEGFVVGFRDTDAVFADDAEVVALQKSFPDRKPPIKEGYRADLQPNQSPRDKDTGKPAMILSVDALDPVNGMVEAVGKWYAGGAVSGFYTFSLKKSGDDWVVESFK